MKSFIQQADGIDWYCEQRGEGPDLVLIPSGEGDCAAFEKTAAILGQHFTVLTFDTPGFSRTSKPADPRDLAGEKLADQIAALVRSLGIAQATFYGCSSGGAAVLDLVAHHTPLVTNAIVHEAAIIDSPEAAQALPLVKMMQLDDAGIAAACKEFFAKVFNEDQQAWEALGPEYHGRLAQNYVTWIRSYMGNAKLDRVFDPVAIAKRPVTWTVGGLSSAARTASNFRLACRAGIEMQIIPCLHFPQVSIPELLAEHIRKATLG